MISGDGQMQCIGSAQTRRIVPNVIPCQYKIVVPRTQHPESITNQVIAQAFGG